ncbi:uncharacterized protein LOC100899181 [Galendromus occidentalis]|uniref:Uncharacterized protein LOC100899181 n=1 Tax=Galendromus occidentalis TaxID=34638 RepID=A0AAJ6QSC5_9ACAR|nr:uncharacterized protein LOC100899181 [Galendromus occidentalis]
MSDKKKTRQPDPFRVVQGEDNSETWKDFREAFLDYALVEYLKSGTPCKQQDSLCNTLQNIIKTLDKKFAPHGNKHFHRHLFARIRQSGAESVSDFVDRVMKAVKPCKFSQETELTINQLTWKQQLFQVAGETEGERSSDSEGEHEETYVEEHGIFTISKPEENKRKGRKFFAVLELPTDMSLRAQIDSGATVSAMSLVTYRKILAGKAAENPLDETRSTVLKAYNNAEMKSLGEFNLKCRYNNQQHSIPFQVLDDSVETLLSGHECLRMGILKVHGSVEQVLKVLKGVDVQLIRRAAPRRPAIATREAFIERIRNMEKEGIIVKVEHPTEWISNAVVVPKADGSVRITLDPAELNKAMKRPRYAMPTLEDHLPVLAKAKWFTICDAKDGFFQLKLQEDSTDLTNFWTPLGRYKYLGMPQGISSAPEEYQQRQMRAYDNLKGCLVVADDTLIYGVGETEEGKSHTSTEKLQLCLKEVRYMRHIISSQGVRSDPKKIKAIEEMARPENSKAVERFLGMVNYHLPFIPQLSDLTAPLREVIKKGNQFVWMESQEKAFNAIKKRLTDSPTLAFYDAKEPVTIQTDSSDLGVGAVMLQGGRPVCYDSHALSEAEKGYIAMEKETLAIVSCCLRWHHLLYGKKYIIVETDHKPLVRRLEKSLEECPKRLQRMRLTLQRFDLKVKYIPGHTNVIADTLSRAPLRDPRAQSHAETLYRLDLEAIRTHDGTAISDPVLEEIRRHTVRDEECIGLIRAMKERSTIGREALLANFRTFKEGIRSDESIIFIGRACYIPKSLRRDM